MTSHRVLLAASVTSLVIGCGGCGPSGSAPGDAGAGGRGGGSVDVSRGWTWQACGSLPPGPAATSARFSPDGQQAFVRDENGGVTLYDVAGSARPIPLGRAAGAVLYAPDGTLLVRSDHDDPRMVFHPLSGAPTPSFSFELPPAKAFCNSDQVGFSASGEYFLTLGGGVSCVWRTVDGSLVTASLNSSWQAAMNGETLVTLMPDVESGKGGVVVTLDLAGHQVGQTFLAGEVESLEDLVLSPAGDRVAGSRTGRLWDAASGAEILSMPMTLPRVMSAVFGGTGEFVLMADGVFRTEDGARVATIPERSSLYLVFDLAPDGHLALSQQIGDVAALSDVSAAGTLRILGTQTVRPNGSDDTGSSNLEISQDGTLLVAGVGRYGPSFAFRVAPHFEDSVVLWSMHPWIASLSADGRFVATAGDDRVVYDMTGGVLLGSEAPDLAQLYCYGTRLRPSPSGRWAAGAGYRETMDVFSLALGPGGRLEPPIVSLPSNCFDSAVFTRDERLMATTEAALFRTGSVPEDWQRLWRHGFLGNANNFQEAASSPHDVTFSPDETHLLVSRCASSACDARLYDVADVTPPVKLPALTAPHPSFSPDGSWIVAGGTLLHLPSGRVQALAPAANASVAVFAPNGDIIALMAGGTLTRYCRTP